MIGRYLFALIFSVALFLLSIPTASGDGQGGYDRTNCNGTCKMYGTRVTMHSHLLVSPQYGNALSFVREQSSTSRSGGLVQAGYYTSNNWGEPNGDCNIATVPYTGYFFEYGNNSTDLVCQVSSSGAPNDARFAVERQNVAGYIWAAYLNGNLIFQPQQLNWAQGPILAGAEFHTGIYTSISICFGCTDALWGYATGVGGSGWTTVPAVGAPFNDDNLYTFNGAPPNLFWVNHS